MTPPSDSSRTRTVRTAFCCFSRPAKMRPVCPPEMPNTMSMPASARTRATTSPAVASWLTSRCTVMEPSPVAAPWPILVQRALAVVDDGHVALLQPAAERHDLPVDPHVGDDRLARIDRRREPHVETGDLGVIVVAHRCEDRPAGGAVGAQAVQDRHREAGALGEIG